MGKQIRADSNFKDSELEIEAGSKVRMKSFWGNWLKELHKKIAGEHGANMVEYALLISLVAVGASAGMLAAGHAVNNVFQQVTTTLTAPATSGGTSGSGSGGSGSNSGGNSGNNGNGNNGNNGNGNGNNGGNGNGNNGNGHAYGHTK